MKSFMADALDNLALTAARASRRRAHLNVHDSADDPVQRLFIAFEPDTYVRPHRHPRANQWEFFVLLAGELDLLLFDAKGGTTRRVNMSANACRAVEIPPNTWHTFICRRPGTLALEIKEGPYIPTAAEDFAPWAPAENSAAVVDYLHRLLTARPMD